MTLSPHSKLNAVRAAKIANAEKIWGNILRLPLHYAIAFLAVVK